jgi:hypothetical protein
MLTNYLVPIVGMVKGLATVVPSDPELWRDSNWANGDGGRQNHVVSLLRRRTL